MIKDQNIRLRLSERYRRMIQQSKANMMLLSIGAAKVQMVHC